MNNTKMFLFGWAVGVAFVWIVVAAAKFLTAAPEEPAQEPVVTFEGYKDSTTHYSLLYKTTKEDDTHLKHLETELQSSTWVMNNNEADATIYETQLPTAQGFVLVQRILDGCGVSGQKVEVTTVDTVRRVRATLYYFTSKDDHPFYEAVIRLVNRQLDNERKESARQDSIKLESQRVKLRAARKQLEVL